jgi:hypothetical protein
VVAHILAAATKRAAKRLLGRKDFGFALSPEVLSSLAARPGRSNMNAPLDPKELLDTEWWRDREIDVPANPGTRHMKYGAVQDIYGQWSLWTSGDQVVSQPDLDPVRLGTVRLLPIAPASGSVCPTTLRLDFYWDWRVRSPKQIKFSGRMYVAASKTFQLLSSRLQAAVLLDFSWGCF